MAKTVAKRTGQEAQSLWNENKDNAAWRADYQKFRDKGFSFTRSVEEASRKSPGDKGGSASTKTAGGKIRRPKRAGAKPVITGGGVGGVTPEEEAESRRYGRGQGKVKRGSKMGKATAKADNTRIGQVAIKRAWAAARKSAGEARWAVMTKEQKTAETLKRVGAMTGEEAIGAVRALGSRVLTLSGTNDGVNEIITNWAKGQGVKAPSTELKIGAKGKAEGKTGKETARAAGKGAEQPAGPEKPKPGMGKKAKRIIRRRTRLDELVLKGEDADSRRRRRAQKPTPDPDVVPGETESERKARLKAARAEDKAFKDKYTVEWEDEDGTTRRIRRGAELPKGVKYRSIEVPTVVATSKDTPDGVKAGAREATKRVTVPMKGNTVYIETGEGWKTMKIDSFRESISDGDFNVAPATKSTKPTPVKSEFPKKMETLSVAGKSLNAEYITESATQAFIDANRKISEKNKIAIGKGTATEDLAPRYKVQDFVDAAYPNLGQAERSALIRGIRKSFRGERKARKAARAAKKGEVTVLRPETVEEGRKKLSAKEVRIAKGKAAPLEKVKLESKRGAKRRVRREKTVGQTLAAVMDPSKPTPSAESMEPAPKQAKRKFVPSTPSTELEANFARLRESLSPTEKGTLRKIKETSRAGFTKEQVKKMATAGTFGKVTPKIRKVAKAGGYLGLVATALQFLEEPNKRKK